MSFNSRNFQEQSEIFSLQKELSNILHAFSLCLGAFGAYDVSDLDDSIFNKTSFASKRIFWIVLCFCGVTNLYVYNAGLISYLMIQSYEIPIEELEDILENPGYKLMVLGGTSDEDFLKFSYHSGIRKLWKIMIKENGNVTNVDEAIKRLMEDDKNVYFGISPEIELIPSIYPCHVVRSKASYYSRSGGYVFRKDSPYIDLFSHHIRKIREMGLDTEIEKTVDQAVDCPDDSEKHFRTLSYNDLIFVFIMLILGCMIAISYSAFECLVKKT